MPEIHPTRITIAGKYWTLTSADIPGFDGLAENSPNVKNKHIWINRNTKGKDLLDTVIHEVVHCFEPRWDEHTVLQFGSELAEILWKLGYRSEDLGDTD
jgi:hypothetical protein